MKKNIMLLVFGIVLISLAFTQNPKKKKQKNPEFKKEMQNYIEKNIVPVLQKKQADFDSKLNADDLSFIEAKRAEAKAKREQHHAERKAKKEEFKKQNPDLIKERREKKEAWKNLTDEERQAKIKEKKKIWLNMTEEERQAERRERTEKHRKNIDPEKAAERKAFRMEMKSFIERNQNLVDATMEDLKSQYEKWTADQLAIIEKYYPEKAKALAEKKITDLPKGLFGLAKKHHKGRHGKRKHHGKKGNRKDAKQNSKDKTERTEGRRHHRANGKKRLAIEFILWDGTLPEAKPREGKRAAKNKINTGIKLGQNYPNPAKSTTNIEVNLPNEMANLNLIITDMNGKVVKQVNLTDLNSGLEVIELNVSDLPNGQYFYSIEEKGINTTKKMTVNH